MALNAKGSLLAISAILAAGTLIWSAGGGISARTRNIGPDRIVSVESLSDANICVMPGMESASLPAAIVTMEKLPQGNDLVCALPTALSAVASAKADAFASPATFPALSADLSAVASAEAGAQEVTAGAGTAYQARTRMGQINQKPARYLKDPYPAWSAVAVNPENDMVVVTDENLFRIVEYSRRDNTPPNGPLTEPRRVIGGPDTKTEMMCGAYIDPKTLDVYVTNNDTQNWLPVFSREARGNAKPDRM